MLIWLLIVALLVIALFPDTPAAKTLRRYLIDEPARIIRESSLRALARAVLVALILAVCLAAAPEAVPLLLSAGDVGLAIELFAALALLAFSQDVLGPLKGLARLVRKGLNGFRTKFAAVRRLARRQRRRRSRPGKRRQDGDPGPGAWAGVALA